MSHVIMVDDGTEDEDGEPVYETIATTFDPEGQAEIVLKRHGYDPDGVEFWIEDQ